MSAIWPLADPSFADGLNKEALLDQVVEIVSKAVRELQPGDSFRVIRHKAEPAKAEYTIEVRNFG